MMKTTKSSGLKEEIQAIDLFCGAGGLTHGLERAGVSVRLGVDIDPACEYPYSENNNADFLLRSVEKLSARDLIRYYGKGSIRLLAGCAPCQTFSTYYRRANRKDKRWLLLLPFARLVTKLSPELVTMENVPGLVNQDVFNRFVSTLKRNGYNVFYKLAKCQEYGIPQRRKRLILLASRLGPIRVLTPSEIGSVQITVKDSIWGMAPLRAGQRAKNDRLHVASGMSPMNLKRIKASRPGGTWADWEKSLVAKCHRKKQGKTYPGVYGRMRWDEVAPTITTQFNGFGNGRFGHPRQNRAISLREGAILQSFPRRYKFVSPKQPVQIAPIARLIGNAVPVRLAEVIGLSLIEHVKGNLK